jgi:hypothetical protein
VFNSREVFDFLCHDSFNLVHKVITFKQSNDVVLRSGLINVVKQHLNGFFGQMKNNPTPRADIHFVNMGRHKDRWSQIRSLETCFSCLRRRPQYELQCGHIFCENCVQVFGNSSIDDPWVFRILHCFLCHQLMARPVSVRMHPPTAGAEVLCIDGGGIKGVVPLRLMKRIQSQIGLPIPIQRLIKVAVGVSSST